MSDNVKSWRVFQRKNSQSQEKSLSISKKYTPKRSVRKNQSLIFPPKGNTSSVKKKNSEVNLIREQIRERTDSKDKNSQCTESIKNLNLGKENQRMNSKVQLGNQEIMNPQIYPKSERKYLVQEIETIKRQFSKFRLTIMKQLERQEFLIRELIERSFEKLASQKILFLQNEAEKYKTDKQFVFPTKNIGEIQSQVSTKLHIPKTTKNSLLTERTVPDQSKDQNPTNFNRFFEAIKILRKNVEDIGDLSERNSIGIPISKNKVENKRLFTKKPKMSYS